MTNEEAAKAAVTKLKIKNGELTWVCSACGRHGPDRYEIGDASCYLNATLCVTSSLEFSDDGRLALKAHAYQGSVSEHEQQREQTER